MDSNLRAFLQQIIHTAHHQAVLPEVLEQKMILDLYLQLEQELLDVVLDQLPEQHHITYLELIKPDTPVETIFVFLEEHIPDIRDQFQQTLISFENDYVTFSQGATSAPSAS